MNVKEYIGSGILEQYLLGELIPAEAREVEKMMALYPEIRQEIFILADTFEKLSAQTGMEPPSDLIDNIMESVGGAKPIKAAKVQDLSPHLPKISINLPLIGLVITSIALLVTAGLAYNWKKSKQPLFERITALQSQIEVIQEEKQPLINKINQLEDLIKVMGSPEYHQINLIGLPLAPQAFAQIFWNHVSREVYLKADQLPKPETGKQYQLWAIVNQISVNLGVFDLPNDPSLIKMTPVAEASAFAVTLEKTGGVSSPTMEAMYVMGKVLTK